MLPGACKKLFAVGTPLKFLAGLFDLSCAGLFSFPACLQCVAVIAIRELVNAEAVSIGEFLMANPISAKLADAFFEAIREYVRWGSMDPEPSMIADSQDDNVPISTVCRRVDTFTDTLPDELYNALYFLAPGKAHKEKLDAEQTYATGAQLLLKLIEGRKTERALASAPLSDSN